jgi:hypothetical protein
MRLSVVKHITEIENDGDVCAAEPDAGCDIRGEADTLHIRLR